MDSNTKTRVLAIADAVTQKYILSALNPQEFATTSCGQGEIISTVSGSPKRFHVVIMTDTIGHLTPENIVEMLNEISALPSGVIILTTDPRWAQYAERINGRAVASALYCTVLLKAVQELSERSPKTEIDPSKYAESRERRPRPQHRRRHRS